MTQRGPTKPWRRCVFLGKKARYRIDFASGILRALMRRDQQPELLDRHALRRGHERHADDAGSADGLSAHTRAELLERLSLLSMTPEGILDAGCGDGEAARALKQRYGKARVVALDHAPRRCRRARRARGWRHRYAVVQGDLSALPFGDDSFDMVFANLSMQDCLPPDPVLRECHRVLSKGRGVLTFATLGPATLGELRSAWDTVDGHAVHVHDFVDMHDLGEALGRCGFGDPVLDVEYVSLTYSHPRALLAELRASGGGCAAGGRRRTLTGARRWQRLLDVLSQGAVGSGRVSITAEVVYGHAWAAPKLMPLGGNKSATEVRIKPASIHRRGA